MPEQGRRIDWLDGQSALPLDEQLAVVRHRLAAVETGLHGMTDHLYGDPRDREDEGVIGLLRAELRGNRRLLQTAVGLLGSGLVTIVSDILANHGHI